MRVSRYGLGLCVALALLVIGCKRPQPPPPKPTAPDVTPPPAPPAVPAGPIHEDPAGAGAPVDRVAILVERATALAASIELPGDRAPALAAVAQACVERELPCAEEAVAQAVGGLRAVAHVPGATEATVALAAALAGRDPKRAVEVLTTRRGAGSSAEVAGLLAVARQTTSEASRKALEERLLSIVARWHPDAGEVAGVHAHAVASEDEVVARVGVARAVAAYFEERADDRARLAAAVAEVLAVAGEPPPAPPVADEQLVAVRSSLASVPKSRRASVALQRIRELGEGSSEDVKAAWVVGLAPYDPARAWRLAITLRNPELRRSTGVAVVYGAARTRPLEALRLAEKAAAGPDAALGARCLAAAARGLP